MADAARQSTLQNLAGQLFGLEKAIITLTNYKGRDPEHHAYDFRQALQQIIAATNLSHTLFQRFNDPLLKEVLLVLTKLHVDAKQLYDRLAWAANPSFSEQCDDHEDIMRTCEAELDYIHRYGLPELRQKHHGVLEDLAARLHVHSLTKDAEVHKEQRGIHQQHTDFLRKVAQEVSELVLTPKNMSYFHKQVEAFSRKVEEHQQELDKIKKDYDANCELREAVKKLDEQIKKAPVDEDLGISDIEMDLHFARGWGMLENFKEYINYEGGFWGLPAQTGDLVYYLQHSGALDPRDHRIMPTEIEKLLCSYTLLSAIHDKQVKEKPIFFDGPDVVYYNAHPQQHWVVKIYTKFECFNSIYGGWFDAVKDTQAWIERAINDVKADLGAKRDKIAVGKGGQKKGFYDEEIENSKTPRELREALYEELAAWHDVDQGGLYITSDTLGTAVSVALFIRGRHLDYDLPEVPSDIAGLLNWCITCEKTMTGATGETDNQIIDENKQPSKQKEERIVNVLNELNQFRFCGPGDDPDEKTNVCVGYYHLVTQLKAMATPYVPKYIAKLLNSVEVELDNIWSVYDAHAIIGPLLTDIRIIITGADWVFPTKKEQILSAIDDFDKFKFCGPGDDPDEKTNVCLGFRYLLSQLKILASPYLPEDINSQLKDIEIGINDLYSVYEANAVISALLPDIEETIQGLDQSAFGSAKAKNSAENKTNEKITEAKPTPESLANPEQIENVDSGTEQERGQEIEANQNNYETETPYEISLTEEIADKLESWAEERKTGFQSIIEKERQNENGYKTLGEFLKERDTFSSIQELSPIATYFALPDLSDEFTFAVKCFQFNKNFTPATMLVEITNELHYKNIEIIKLAAEVSGHLDFYEPESFEYKSLLLQVRTFFTATIPAIAKRIRKIAEMTKRSVADGHQTQPIEKKSDNKPARPEQETKSVKEPPKKAAQGQSRTKKKEQDKFKLIAALMQYHKFTTKDINLEPAGQKELRSLTGWSQPKIHRGMKELFGDSPMEKYKRCFAQGKLSGFMKKLEDGTYEVEGITESTDD